MSRLLLAFPIVVFTNIALFVVEYILSKRNSKIAIILPIIIACFFVILGFYAVIIAAIMYGIYFVVQYVEKDKQSKLSEIEKMNIEDL